jgi:SAM-dependent methyltransferase
MDTTKSHYDNHLAHFYSWMAGDFDAKVNDFKAFCEKHGIAPNTSKYAVDLGAGHGIQSIALADLGFRVDAIDFNAELLGELESRRDQRQIRILTGDLRDFRKHIDDKPELIVCCGDTITHLESLAELERLFIESFASLADGGKLLLSFRDYSHEMMDTKRFIPVKSDPDRILTCVLEYLPGKVRVTDLLYERDGSEWKQKVSSYYKLRLSPSSVMVGLVRSGFQVEEDSKSPGLVYIIAKKVGLS